MAREDQPPCTESTYSRRPSKKVRLPPGMEAGPAGRSLVECLNNIKILEENGIRFISVTQGLDTDIRNPASRFLLHVLGAAAEFERH